MPTCQLCNEINLTPIIGVAMIIVRRCVSFMSKTILHVASGIKCARVREILLSNGQRDTQGSCPRSGNFRKDEVASESWAVASSSRSCAHSKYGLHTKYN